MLATHQRRHLWQMEQILGGIEEQRALKNTALQRQHSKHIIPR
jgi:hypothetical protein